MNRQIEVSIHSLFEQWKAEDEELDACLDLVRDWMRQVSQLGMPRFGETASRLQNLGPRLIQHFDREDEMGVQLTKFYAADSAELGGVMRQAARDHSQLMDRLDDLIRRLGQVDPPFESWEAAMDEVESFVVALERHEVQERENIVALIPPQAQL